MKNNTSNTISMKIFGNAEVTDRILTLIANELGVEVSVTNEKTYTTKRGHEGRFTDAQFRHTEEG